MARDFWRQGFEFQPLTAFGEFSVVDCRTVDSTEVLEICWQRSAASTPTA